MIRAIARDDLVPAGKKLCHLHGVFVGFGAAQREKCFRQASNFGEFLAQQAAWFRGKTRSRETEFFNLLLDRFQHFGVLVADV